MEIKVNMGQIDRLVRVVLAGALLWAFISNVVAWPLSVLLIVIALVFILTSFSGFCPLYTLFKFDTLKFNITKKNN
jgi:hypothetical protein